MFKLGDKVVPHQKTVSGWDGLDESLHWNKACSRGQKYLYIVGYDEEEQAWKLNADNTETSGDFYREKDFTLYEEELEWELLYLESREELDKHDYRSILEWVELHTIKIEGTTYKNELVKFKEDEKGKIEGRTYALRISNQKVKEWAKKEYLQKPSILLHRSSMFCSDKLEDLIELNEKSKEQIGA